MDSLFHRASPAICWSHGWECERREPIEKQSQQSLDHSLWRKKIAIKHLIIMIYNCHLSAQEDHVLPEHKLTNTQRVVKINVSEINCNFIRWTKTAKSYFWNLVTIKVINISIFKTWKSIHIFVYKRLQVCAVSNFTSKFSNV